MWFILLAEKLERKNYLNLKITLKEMNEFFEFFIEKLLWLWLPFYAFYRVLKDIIEDWQKKEKK